MRVWQRNSLQLAAIVPFDDWVFSLASRGGHVLAGLSSRFHVLDQCSLQPLKQLYHQVGCNQHGNPAWLDSAWLDSAWLGCEEWYLAACQLCVHVKLCCWFLVPLGVM